MTSPTSLSRDELAARIAANLTDVDQVLARHGRSRREVAVVAVTKTHTLDTVLAAYEAGLRCFGENYVDELVAKSSATSALPDVEWQFLGALQSRKIRTVAQHAQLVATVSRLKEIERLAECDAPVPRILVQVDYTGAAGRNGADATDVSGLIAAARQRGLRVTGLMTVAPVDPSAAQRAFHELAALAAGEGLQELSMGMSGDYEMAVSAGATHIRLGQALFGPRNPVTAVS